MAGSKGQAGLTTEAVIIAGGGRDETGIAVCSEPTERAKRRTRLQSYAEATAAVCTEATAICRRRLGSGRAVCEAAGRATTAAGSHAAPKSCVTPTSPA